MSSKYSTVKDPNLRKQQLCAVREHEKTLESERQGPYLMNLRMSAKAGTEPCDGGSSNLHHLNCGHTIYTKQNSVCGRTCITPIENFTPFVCTLCERQKMIHSGQIKQHRSSRVTELILPDFPDFDQSHVPMMMRARECNIALVLWSKTVFMPYTAKDIAAFRVKDNRRLDGILEDIIDAAKDMGFSQAVIKGISEGLITCVDHQHLWVNATYGQLATAILYITAVRAGIEQPGVLNQLSMCLGASTKGIKQLLPRVSVLLIDTRARYAIASFIPTLEKTYPACRKYSKNLARLELKLWSQMLEYRRFQSEFMAVNWRRTITSCIFAVTTVNDIFLTTEEISAAIGAVSPGIDGYDMDTYILSNIVDDGAYQIKTLAVKPRRQRKLKNRRARCATDIAVVVTSTPDPIFRLHRSFEMISFNDFVGSTSHDDVNEMEDVKRRRDGEDDVRRIDSAILLNGFWGSS